MKNIAIGGVIVAAALGALAFFGLTPYGKTVIRETIGSSSAGTTFNTAKFAAISVNLATAGANATSSSILNGDSNDRFITAVKAGCQGVGSSQTVAVGAGLASLTFKVATSAAATPTGLSNTNLVGQMAFTIGTSTANFVMASSTAAGQNGIAAGNGLVNNIWASGSYLTFFFTATNTATCVLGVDYMGS